MNVENLCCKTMFLLEMAKGLDKTYFANDTSASGPGIIDYLRMI